MKVKLTNPNDEIIEIEVKPNIVYRYEYFDDPTDESELTDIDALKGKYLQHSFNLKDTKVIEVREQETNKKIYNFHKD